MSSSDVKSLEKIINECLLIKEKLDPDSGIDDAKRNMMEKIRAAFPKLEKRDCTTPYSCIKLVIPTAVKTLADAKKLIPKFKKLIPYLFKRDSYSSSEIHFGPDLIRFGSKHDRIIAKRILYKKFACS